MTIHLISFASILHKQASLRNSHEAILSEIEKYYTVKLVDYQDMDKLVVMISKSFLSLPVVWKDWSSSTSNVFPAPPFYWQTACRTHLLPHWKSPHGYGTWNEE